MMFPKRHSQIACGILHSACDHWVFTVSGKFSFFIPGSLSVEAEERSKEKLLVATAHVKEVGVIGHSSFGAEGFPSSPDPIVLFVGVFLSGVKDDSAVHTFCMTQGKTLLGRAEIAKERGICDGGKIWKRWVSTLSEGSRAASLWSCALVLPVYESRSASLLFSPSRCCDMRQWSLSRTSVARF